MRIQKALLLNLLIFFFLSFPCYANPGPPMWPPHQWNWSVFILFLFCTPPIEYLIITLLLITCYSSDKRWEQEKDAILFKRLFIPFFFINTITFSIVQVLNFHGAGETTGVMTCCGLESIPIIIESLALRYLLSKLWHIGLITKPISLQYTVLMAISANVVSCLAGVAFLYVTGTFR